MTLLTAFKTACFALPLVLGKPIGKVNVFLVSTVVVAAFFLVQLDRKGFVLKWN